jgi:beta-galactosidase
VPITTNFMGFFKPLDHWQWAPELDFASWDSYPDPATGHAAELTAASGHDLTRSLKKDRPWVLLEQVTSQVNWRPTNVLKRPGVMRLWSLQAVARGADGIMFFQWRAAQGGAEKFHGALVPHVGVKNSRVFREAKALGAELPKLAPVAGSTIRSRAAIAIDWNAWWAVELDSRPGRIDYAGTIAEFYRFFFERNIPVDFVHPGADLADYDLVVAPALYLLGAKAAANLERFVARGGVFLTTYFSGIVDENERIVLGGYPALLRKTLGLWVEEWSPMMEGETNRVRFGREKRTAKASHWCDVVHLEGARALATFEQDFFAGSAAFTVNAFGQGSAYYLATKLAAPDLDRVLEAVCARAELAPLLRAPKHVEVTLRENEQRGFLFLLNHGTRPATVALGKFAGQDLLSGRRVARSVKLGGLGAAVVALR